KPQLSVATSVSEWIGSRVLRCCPLAHARSYENFASRAKLAAGEFMVTIICDRCGQPMDKGQLRYVAKIQVFAAYDPLEISFDDLQKETKAEIQKLLKQREGKSEAELMKKVVTAFEFDLCPTCQREYVREPLPVK